MNYLSTSTTSVTFTNAQGVTKTIVKNYIWYRINEDTVTFLVLPDADPGGDGTCFFASKIEDLTINGTVYTSETIVEALDDIFEPVNVTDVYTKEQINEMLEDYATVAELDEFIDADELATVLGDYQEKLTAGTGITIENNVISATGGGGGSVTVDSTWIPNSTNPAESQLIQSALGDKANSADVYTKSQTDNLLNGKISQGTLATVATSGSYNDLSDKPTIPAAQVQSSWTESDTSSKAYILGKPNLATVATSGSYNDLSNTPDLTTKQDTLVSGTNIKTVNGNSLLGSGNIEISSGGTQVQSDWTEADSSSMAYILHKPNLATVATSGAYSDLSGKPTNVSSFTNDAGYLTQHQSLADVFADVVYDSQTKHINFYGKGDTQHTTVLAYVDATSFVVDGMVSNVEVKSVTISGTPTTCLVITFNSDAGKQDINIPISQIFDASNYYTKSDIDNAGYMTDLSWEASYDDVDPNDIGVVIDVTGPVIDSSGYWIPTVIDLTGQDGNNMAAAASGVIAYVSAELAGYQEALTAGTGIDITSNTISVDADSAPTNNSSKPVTSGGVYTALGNKQDTLVSGTNIKTINGNSLLGTGDITISGGSSITVDSTWVANSTNPAESQLIQTALGGKQDTLTAGTGISISGNTISSTITQVTVDQTLNALSTNAISNAAVTAAIGDIEAALQAINGTTPSNP